MRARILVRAGSLIGFALTAWSNNVRWGSDASLRGGPPMQWERAAVGAALLSALAALAVWLGTRPASTGPWLRVAACAFALAVAAIALYLRSEANRIGIADVLNGPGWTWLVAGAVVSIGAAAGSLALRGPIRKNRGRRRGAVPRAR
jgi:hypothetical protein